MTEIQDWKGLSTYDKIKHKNWKARLEGYEELLKELQLSNKTKDPLFNTYLGLLKVMVVDNNAAVHEKSLEVVLKFVYEADIGTNSVNDICSGIVNKCFMATKKRITELAFEILKSLIEIEKQEVVFEELLNGLSCKIPKVVVGSINALKDCLHDFGPKVIPIKNLLGLIPRLLEDRDKGVREAAKELVIEIYQWIGDNPIKSILSQIKPVQVTGLAAEFKQVNVGKSIPCRHLRSQKPKLDTVLQYGGERGPCESTEPVEVVSKIPGNYYEKIEEKKWSDRKEALEVINNLTYHEKLMPGNYWDLINSLLKVVAKDTNNTLVAMAAGIISQISHGLGKKFAPYSQPTIQTCLEKFKEKKSNVVNAMRTCIDSALEALSLEQCLHEFQYGLNHKTPSVRSETALLLSRAFAKVTMETLSMKLLKQLIPAMESLCFDSSSGVRDAAFQALGMAMKIGEDKMRSFLGNMDNIKLARINEFYEKAKAGVLLDDKSPVTKLQNETENTCEEEIDEIRNTSKNVNNNRKRKSSDSLVNLVIDKGNHGDSPSHGDEPEINEDDDLDIKQFSEEPDRLHGPIITGQHETIGANELDENLLICSNFTNPNDILFDRKNSEYSKCTALSKFPDQELIDSYRWIHEFNQLHERSVITRACLLRNPIKQVINNLHNSNMTASLWASDSINKIVASNPLVLQKYAPFLLIILCQQMFLIDSLLKNRNIDIGKSEKCLKNVYFHLSQVFENKEVSEHLDDELVVMVMAVLLELSRCKELSGSMSECVTGAAAMIYKCTLEQPFTNIVKTVAAQIVHPDSSVTQVDLFVDTDIPAVLEKMYMQCIQLGDECVPQDEIGQMDELQMNLSRCQPYALLMQNLIID